MLAREFGRFIAATRYESMPQDVIEAVKLRILDTLAAHLAGLKEGRIAPLLQLLESGGEAAVWGAGVTRSLRDATIINSAVSHAVYFEDGSRYTGGHPSSAVIPGALTLAADRRASGRQALVAIAAGYEVFLRLGRALYPSTVNRGFQSTAILAAPSTAAASASILGLGESQSAHALAIACSHGAGLKEALKSSDTQPLQVGRSAEGGLLAALYAAQGGGGAEQAFERGLLIGYADGVNCDSIAAGLGEEWRIFETYLKVHGGCRGNHAPTDAFMNLMCVHQVDARQIAQAKIFVDTVTYAANIDNPTGGNQAQFSIRFSAAVAAVKGDALPFRFADVMLTDKEVLSLMQRIAVMVDPSLDAGYPKRRAARVELALTNGRILVGSLDNARGEPEYPLGVAEVERKFRLMAEGTLGVAADSIIDKVANLDRLKDVANLTSLIRGRL